MKNRKRNRLKGYDYSRDNLYFVTICVQDRRCCLGSVVAIGTGRDLSVPVVAVGTGHDLSVPYPDKNHSRENIVMQLNQYGLVVEERINWLSEQYGYVDVHNFVVMPNHVHLILEIDSQKVKDVKIKSLSELIGALKTTSSKMIHESGFVDFSWQRSFHDHIIRNEKSYLNIFHYIDLNPHKWFEDTFFERG